MRSILISILLAISTLTGSCKTGESDDVVVGHYTPDIAPKHCWQLGIAVGGDDRKVSEICVSEKVFHKYKNGDTYHG